MDLHAATAPDDSRKKTHATGCQAPQRTSSSSVFLHYPPTQRGAGAVAAREAVAPVVDGRTFGLDSPRIATGPLALLHGHFSDTAVPC